jgi:putative membrane protein insertion efficiency factor
MDAGSQALERRPGAPARLALWYIETYRARVAPVLPSRCRFVPTCSAYGLEAYRTYSFPRATAKTVWRILRCHPFRHGTGIHDPP